MRLVEIAEKANVPIRSHYDETGSTPKDLKIFTDAFLDAFYDHLTTIDLEQFGIHPLRASQVIVFVMKEARKFANGQ